MAVTGWTSAQGITIRLRLIAGIVAAFAWLCLGLAGPAAAQTENATTTPATASAPTPADAAPTKVQELLNLLDDPTVRGWLEGQRAGTAQAASPATAAPAASPADGFTSWLSSGLARIRLHLHNLAGAAPALPDQFRQVGQALYQELQDRELYEVLLLFATFVAIGFGLEWLFRRLTLRLHGRILASRMETVGERLRMVAARFAYTLGVVTAFAVGSIGAFLIFPWPPLLRDIVVGYLFGFLLFRLVLVVARLLLAPSMERFRIIPLDGGAARFWMWRIGVFIGWFAFGHVTLTLLMQLGFDKSGRHIVAYTLALGLLATAIETTWRRPHFAVSGPGDRHRGAHTLGNALLTGYFIVLWLLWALNAKAAFWLAAVLFVVPTAIRVTQAAVNHILRPPGSDEGEQRPSVVAVALERGARAGLIIGAVLFLAYVWGIDFVALTAGDTVGRRLIRGALNAVVIVLVADFAWHVLKTLIDNRLATVNHGEGHDLHSEEARRHARVRTLLPILRNVLFIVLAVMTVLMALSAMGVEIGPLIAGAGVVGVAVGFGAQTLVKDIISGMFYLLDDAFRVGEYIQSGSYKGTVESFSLRSIKLRHHRGPLYTVPFGMLGAVENMSRDWVIDKMTINVPFDADLDLVKKIIKTIGKQLTEIPDFAPHIMETLKMQGVDQFGDYAVQIRMKMKTKPGEQFVIRRRALAMLKKAFADNGIRFATPTVQVSGHEGEAAAAAAQKGLEATHPKAAEPAA